MNTTAFVSGIPITLNYVEMDESLRSWIQKIVSGEKTNIFARIMHDDIVFFYTDEGLSFHDEKIKLPPIMHFDRFLVGVIYADCQEKNTDAINLTVKLVANPKESDKETTELVKFKKDITERFGL